MINLSDIRPEARRLIYLYMLAHGFMFAFPLLALLSSEASGLEIKFTLVLLSAAVLLTSLIGPWTSSLMDQGKGEYLCYFSIVSYGAGIAALIIGQEAGLTFLGVCLALFLISSTIQAGIGSFLIEGVSDASQRGRISTIWATGGNVGMIFSSLLGLWLMPLYKVPLLSMDFLTTSLFLIYGAMVFRRQGPRIKMKAHVAFVNTFKKIFDHSSIFIASAFLYSLIFAQIYLFPFLFKVHGMEDYKMTTWMGALNSTVVVGMGFLIARGTALKSLRMKSLVTCGMMAVGFALMPLVKAYWSVAIATFIWSIGEITIYPVVTQVIFDVFPPEQASLATSLKVFLFRLGQVFAPIFSLLVLLLPERLQATTLFVLLILVGWILDRHIQARNLQNA